MARSAACKDEGVTRPIWAPWRLEYVGEAGSQDGCVFCAEAAGVLGDASLLVVLAYAGLRPQEALALEWRHVRERTLLVERALSDGELKVLKNRRQLTHT